MSSTSGRLGEIQRALKVPKDQFNAFGKYKYRNAEDILNAVKQQLKPGESITLSEDIIEVGGRVYVRSVATLTIGEQGEFSAIAHAREPEHKKGMDESQITGSSSSYARKYALGGLFAIDDGRDADSSEPPANQPPARKAPPPRENGPTQQQRREMSELAKQLGWTSQDIRAFGESTVGAKGSMTKAQADEMLRHMARLADSQSTADSQAGGN